METAASLDKSHYLAVPPEEFLAMADALYRFGAGRGQRRSAPVRIRFLRARRRLDFTSVAKKLGFTIPVFEGRKAIADIILQTTSRLDTTRSIANPQGY